MIVEDVVVEFTSDLVSDLILITPSEHGILTAVADEGGRDPVVSQGVRRLPGLPPQGDDAVQDYIYREFMREEIGEGQMFFFYKRKAMKQMM